MPQSGRHAVAREWSGLPVLARINAGNDLESLIDTAGIGRACVGDAPERLLRSADELANDADLREAMGRRARALADSAFSTARAVTQVVQGL